MMLMVIQPILRINHRDSALHAVQAHGQADSAAEMRQTCVLVHCKEIAVLRSLSYDRNLVQFYGACLEREHAMLVLEYMEGGDLLTCIQNDCYPVKIGKFTWYQAGGRIALDVAKGLVFLHGQKVVPSALRRALSPVLASEPLHHCPQLCLAPSVVC